MGTGFEHGLSAQLQILLQADDLRRRALEAVAALNLPDGWIGAGFLRDAVWDHLHGYGMRPPVGDVDVLWHSPAHAGQAEDRQIERQLHQSLPGLAWSVKNQARMNLRNGDAPYLSVADAMRNWPETATAVAVRLEAGAFEINAPFGLDDLFAMRLRPTPAFIQAKRLIYEDRIVAKQWLQRYPRVTQFDMPQSGSPTDCSAPSPRP